MVEIKILAPKQFEVLNLAKSRSQIQMVQFLNGHIIKLTLGMYKMGYASQTKSA